MDPRVKPAGDAREWISAVQYERAAGYLERTTGCLRLAMYRANQ